MAQNIIKERIAALRAFMLKEGVQAFVVPSTDPHQSEYVAAHWEARAWISGFTGSAGTVAVTMTRAGLWTDSRYFLQAVSQLKDTGIDLYKLKIAGTPTIAQMIAQELPKGSVVGVDGNVLSVSEAEALRKELSEFGLQLKLLRDPFEEIWTGRPEIPSGKVRIQKLEHAGLSAAVKMTRLRHWMDQKRLDCFLVTALDEIAWLLNIRGTDVHCNPVLISYVALLKEECHVFISKEKLTPEAVLHFKEAGCTLHGYEDISVFLSGLRGLSVGFSPSQLCASLYACLDASCTKTSTLSFIQVLKAIKNPVEIEGYRKAMRRDGVAMCRFLMWLETALDEGTQTEVSVSRKLRDLRAEQDLFLDESFDTIAGYGYHGAIVHYEPTAETDIPLEKKGFLLLDSGAQYEDGTTDITRTIPLGELSMEEREDYTLILKGNLDMAMAVFPEGTRGSQVDILARLPLWKRHMNYLHGTGHGVGSCLNVHEGPHSIRMEENPMTLMAGMTVTDEPGIYKEGKWGVRTENVLLIENRGEGMFTGYLGFEVLTLCPISTSPIVRELLDEEEIVFLNAYHERVFKTLSPLLRDSEIQWLREATRPI